MQDIVAKRSKRSAGARSRAIAVAMQPLEKRVLLSTAYLQPSPLAMYIKPKTKPVAPVTTPTVTAKPVAKPTTTAKPAVSGFSTGDLVVYRVGDGSAALGTSATATFIDEYTTATGQSSPVSGATVALSTPSSGNPLTASGSASSQGYITDSGDGEALLVPGYDAATGTASITGTTSAVPREVDELSPTGATTSQTTIGSGTSSVGTIYGATANTSTSGI